MKTIFLDGNKIGTAPTLVGARKLVQEYVMDAEEGVDEVRWNSAWTICEAVSDGDVVATFVIK